MKQVLLLPKPQTKVATTPLTKELLRVTFEQGGDLLLNKEYLDLTVFANGKAELYFHAYFWTTYAAMLGYSPLLENQHIKKIGPLAQKPKTVMDQIRKFQFSEAEYKELVSEFGSLKSKKR